MTGADALDVAVRIADHLCSTAIEYDGRCTWMGTVQDADEESEELYLTYETLPPDLYGGTGGIALFLAEAYAHAPNARYREIADAALAQTLARLDKIPRRQRFGPYGGLTGIAYACFRVAELTGLESYRSRARDMLVALASDLTDEMLLDVISGAAGAIPLLLTLARTLNAPELSECAVSLGEKVLAAASKSDLGWSWGEEATGFDTARHLTGFAHGAAGMAWSLLALYQAGGDARFLEGAREAFRYENHWFRPERDNWPDFRSDDGSDAPAHCMVAWCHGGPGIGLSRLCALVITNCDEWLRDAKAAVASTIRTLRHSDPDFTSDFSPCHGKTGLAEFLLLASDALGDDEARDTALDVAERGAARYGETPALWPCSPIRGSTPSLMLGLAGIGYFYLRVSNPSTPSLLLL